MKKTKKYLEQENEWLWYSHIDIEDNTKYISVTQRNIRGTIIARSESILPKKKHRPKHPTEI